MQRTIKDYMLLFLKGLGVGAANIIPGVSGGTIALITGIFEELINSIKSIDLKAIRLLFTGKLRTFQSHTNLYFLIAVFGGAATGIYLLAFILEPLFRDYPHFVWAFFLGLIMASVIFVGRKVAKWSPVVIAFFVAGTAIALFVTTVLKPATENDATGYLFICGIVAICSMILPGLSGSYVLLLMGNYELVMIQSVKNMDFSVLLPLVFGAFFGLISFAYLLAWVFKKYRDQTISLLIGFIFGSLGILWPWKNAVFQIFEGGKEKVVGYDYYLPPSLNAEVLTSILFVVAGFLIVWLVEKLAGDDKKNN